MRQPRFLVTRPAEQGAALVRALAVRGVEGLHVPTVAIRPAAPERLAEALADEAWDWIVVTSVNGAAPLAAAAALHPLPASTRVAAVGEPSAAALRAAGLRVDHVPNRFLTVAIADGLGPLEGRRVLLARADAATPALRDALLARGADVREEVAYETVEGPESSRGPLLAALDERLDGITFTSGSTVRGVLSLLPTARIATAQRLATACIGPVTAAVARRHGWQPAIVAERHTAEGLADAIAHHLAMEIPA